MDGWTTPKTPSVRAPTPRPFAHESCSYQQNISFARLLVFPQPTPTDLTAPPPSFTSAEEHLTRAPHDVKAWISYAQMVKRPRGDEEVVSRLQPGMVAATDVSVSRQSVFRARRVLHRAIASCEDNSSKAVVLQTLGLLELTHGNETYGSALLEFCVGQSGGALAPVLRWHRVRAARRSVVAASGGGGGGVGRLRRARENVQSRVLLPSAFMREEPTPEA